MSSVRTPQDRWSRRARTCQQDTSLHLFSIDLKPLRKLWKSVTVSMSTLSLFLLFFFSVYVCFKTCMILRRHKQEDCHKLRVSLVYVVSSRLDRTTLRDYFIPSLPKQCVHTDTAQRKIHHLAAWYGGTFLYVQN